MSRLYDVRTERFGTVTKAADSIDEARAWARKAFGGMTVTVAPHVEKRLRCEGCDSRPCCCGGVS